MRKDASIFAFIQDSTLDGIWFWDLQRPENEWMSDSFWRNIGYNPLDMAHSPSAWMDKVHPDDIIEAKNRIDAHITDPKIPYEQVIRYYHKNGSIRFIRCTGKVLYDDNGKPWRMLGAHIDITSEREHQIELEKSAVYLESLFRSIPDLIFVVNRDGTIIDFKGDSSTDRLLVSPEEFMGKRIQEMLPEETAQRLDVAIGKLSEGEYSSKVDYSITLNGRLMNFNASLTRIESDKFLIVASEITEIKSEQFISSQLISKMPECVAIIDLKGNLIEINPAFEKLLGKSRHDLLKEQHPFSFLQPEHNHRLYEAFQALVYGGVAELEMMIQKDDGTQIPVAFNLSTINDPLGATLRYFATIIDISYKKRVEKRLRQVSERLQRSQRVGGVGYFEIEANSGKWMVSEALMELLGLKDEEFIGHDKWMALIVPEFLDYVKKNVEMSFQSLNSLHIEFPVMVAGREESIWLEVRAEAVSDEENNEVRLSGYTVDITERVKHLQSIDARNRRLMEVAWMQSHNVRAPLARLTALTETFKENANDLDKQRFISEEIIRTTHELDEIIRDITEKSEALIHLKVDEPESVFQFKDKEDDKLHVILVDDDPVVLMLQENNVRTAMLDEEPMAFNEAEDALRYLVSVDTSKVNGSFLILLDINMPVMNGWDFLDKISFELRHLNIFVLMVTSSTNIADKQRANQYYQVIGFVEKVLTKQKVESFKELVPLRKYYNN